MAVRLSRCPAELVVIDGQPVIVHYDDTPESDISSVDGIRCTTPLRTVIDLAPQLGRDDLAVMVRQFLSDPSACTPHRVT